MLMNEGHIDRCIRRAISCGIVPELALRMATLSAADRFGLHDRGALAPGRRADFCLIDDPEKFVVQQVFVGGRDLAGILHEGPSGRPILRSLFKCTLPSLAAIRIESKGTARVIGLVRHQIVTKFLRIPVDTSALLKNDILKIVVCNRYGSGACGVGLVQGFGFKKGAIASSVAHDAHNLIAAGTSDHEIMRAIEVVIQMQGGMAAVAGDQEVSLPLDCGGLMSSLPYPDVAARLHELQSFTRAMGGIDDPFMYLSFLSLTVIPELRITDRGVFDTAEFRDVPLFVA
jgi:adenine deaminase